MIERFTSVMIIGRTNVGKSTLFNRMIGKKINATSGKVFTTISNCTLRSHIDGIYYTDTKGNWYNKNHDHQILVWVVGVNRWQKEEEDVLCFCQQQHNPVILVINRVDSKYVTHGALDFSRKITSRMQFVDHFFISAKHNHNLNLVRRKISVLSQIHFSHQPPLEEEITCTRQIKAICREKLLHILHDDVPYRIGVTVSVQEEHVTITLKTEHKRHKKILIGHNGIMINKFIALVKQDLKSVLPYCNMKITIK